MMLGKIKTAPHSPEQANMSSIKQDIESLKNSRTHLKKEVMQLKADSAYLKAEVGTLLRKLETTFQFFEIRVDQIYRNLTAVGAIDPDARDAASALQLATNPEWEKLIFAAKSPHLEPGLIPSPITLSGMRIDTRYATEKLHYTEIAGEVSEIAVFGPYRKLLAGEYTLTLALEPLDPEGELSLYLEVFTTLNGREIEVAGRPIEDTQDTRLSFEWDIELSDCEVQFRIHQRGGDALRLFGMDLARQ
jgi:hypothetical protein